MDGYPDITPTSREFIDHWTNPEACQLCFAQLDAIRTHIHWHEVAQPEIRDRLHDTKASTTKASADPT